MKVNSEIMWRVLIVVAVFLFCLCFGALARYVLPREGKQRAAVAAQAEQNN